MSRIDGLSYARRLDSRFRTLLIILSPQQEEEVYFFRSDPRAFDIDLLLTVDESSYEREL
jgi:hypothetical protein